MRPEVRILSPRPLQNGHEAGVKNPGFFALFRFSRHGRLIIELKRRETLRRSGANGPARK